MVLVPLILSYQRGEKSQFMAKDWYCWWKKPAPVEVGCLSHNFQRSLYIQVVVGDFWTINSVWHDDLPCLCSPKKKELNLGCSPSQDASQHQDYEPFLVGNPNPNLHFHSHGEGGQPKIGCFFVPAFDQQWAIHCDIGRNELRLKGKGIGLETSFFWNHPPTQHVLKGV